MAFILYLNIMTNLTIKKSTQGSHHAHDECMTPKVNSICEMVYNISSVTQYFLLLIHYIYKLFITFCL